MAIYRLPGSDKKISKLPYPRILTDDMGAMNNGLALITAKKNYY